MTDTDVQAHLELARQDQALTVRAYVSAAPARTLRWRVTTSSNTNGGVSNVSQSGTTLGASDAPVAVTVVSPRSAGTVVLTVFEGANEIARDTLHLDDFEPSNR